MAKQTFETRVKKLFTTFAKSNRTAHELAIEALVHYGQHNDSTLVERFTAVAFGHQQYFRYQAFKAWLEAFTDLKVKEPGPNQERLEVRRDKNGKGFTAANLEKCKATPFYDYMPADKPLTAPKIPESLEVTLARGLLTGEITEQQIQEWASHILENAKKKQTDSKVIDWSVKYMEQLQAKAA